MVKLALLSSVCGWLAFGLGCSTSDSTAQASAISADLANAPAAPAAALPTAILPTMSEEEAKALLRAYGPADMKLATCVATDQDGVITGDNCASNILVFGPYLRAPSNSEVRVSFDIQAETELFLTSDIISEVGRRFHGSLDEQSFAAGEKRHVGYGVRLFEPAVALETRIGVRSASGARFKITNLTIRVQ